MSKTTTEALEADAPDHLPAVAGRRCTATLTDFIQACRVHLADLEESVSPDSMLRATLCDAVRLAREFGDVMHLRDARKDGNAPFLFLYPLFAHMSHNHGLTLTDSELEDIRHVCEQIAQAQAAADALGGKQ